MSHGSALRDFGIRKPVVPSLAAAQAEFNLWLRENTFEVLKDRSGGLWSVAVELKQGPGPLASRAPRYSLTFDLVHEIDVGELCRTGILNEETDSRLLHFLQGLSVSPLKQRMGFWEGESLGEIQAQFKEACLKAGIYVSQHDFQTAKRRRLGECLSQASMFTSRVTKE